MSSYANPEQVVATRVLLTSRGLVETATGFELAEASAVRADFTAGYWVDHEEEFKANDGYIVTPTSFSPFNDFTHDPAPGECEGPQNGERMMDGGVPSSFLIVDHVAASTLEEVLYVREHPGIGAPPKPFTPQSPLGIVSQDGQMDRALYLARRGLHLPKKCLLPLVAPGFDEATVGVSERTLYVATRLMMIGANTPRAMRHRELLGSNAMHLVHAFTD